MKSFYINPTTNDLEFDGSNNIKMVEGDDELLQSVKMICATNIDEWFLNKRFGFDRAIIQGKKVDYNRAIDALYAAILQEERIATVEEISFDYAAATRTLRIDFVFTKKDGQMVEGGFSV